MKQTDFYVNLLFRRKAINLLFWKIEFSTVVYSLFLLNFPYNGRFNNCNPLKQSLFSLACFLSVVKKLSCGFATEIARESFPALFLAARTNSPFYSVRLTESTLFKSESRLDSVQMSAVTMRS